MKITMTEIKSAQDGINSRSDIAEEKTSKFKNKSSQGFPVGTVVKNLPANAGDMGLSPGPGRSQMPRSNWACEPQLLKPVRLEPVLCNKRSHHNEKPAHRNEE